MGPILFIICINDVNVGLNHFINKVADDTKIGNSNLTGEDKLSLKKHLHAVSAWSEMPFNIEKS